MTKNGKMKGALFAAVAQAAALLSAGALAGAAVAAEPLRIAYIDPLSGGLAQVGDEGLKHFVFAAERLNKAGGLNGAPIEIVAFDNKLSAEESLIVLQKAIDQGIRFVTQGNGSSVAYALVDAIEKHNRRNPGKELVFLNYAAIDPGLTNAKCSYWHFRFDAHVDMKMAALAKVLKDKPATRNVFLINQDYSFGHSVAEAARRMIPEVRPDVKLVGDDFHPIGKVKDFTPYVAKMQASGADTVITSNWGNDMTLLVKAANDAGLKVDFLTFYAGGLGAPKVIGDSSVGRLKQITEWHENIENPEMEGFATAYAQRYPGLNWYYLRIKTLMDMLAQAAGTAGSNEPVRIAKALEGMKTKTPFGEVWMRADDHQLFQPLYLSTWTKGVKYDVSGQGNGAYGFKTDERIEAADTVVPTTCQMKRPN